MCRANRSCRLRSVGHRRSAPSRCGLWVVLGLEAIDWAEPLDPPVRPLPNHPTVNDIRHHLATGAALRDRGGSALLDTFLCDEVLPIRSSRPAGSDVIGHVVPPFLGTYALDGRWLRRIRVCQTLACCITHCRSPSFLPAGEIDCRYFRFEGRPQ